MGRGLTPEELAEYEAKRRKELEENARKLGVTPEWILEQQAKATAELEADDEWEKELDRKNREKAGIE